MSENCTKEPKFKVGQVLMFRRDGKKPLPFTVLEVSESEGSFFYRIDRNNFLHESMLRPLTAEEAGEIWAE